jgi:hypothetical protein
MTMEPPKAAIRAFDVQRRSAKRRGIPFLLTFVEWWDWWKTDRRWDRRGRKRDSLVMARLGDVGPYAIDNIYCSTHRNNWRLGYQAASTRAKQTATKQKTGGYAHLKNRAAHPKRHPVISPKGAFPSIALAAEANNLTAHYAQKLASRGVKGWRYADHA